jgi:serine/threonine protein kinase
MHRAVEMAETLHAQTTTITETTTINWKIGPKLGEGALGIVYEVTGFPNGELKGILKKAKTKEAIGTLRIECQSLKFIRENGLKGFPTLYNQCNGADFEDNPFIIMQKVGSSFESSQQKVRTRQKTNEYYISNLISTLCSHLRKLHDLKRVHKDIAPDNVCFDTDDLDTPYFIDLGLMSRYPPGAELNT